MAEQKTEKQTETLTDAVKRCLNVANNWLESHVAGFLISNGINPAVVFGGKLEVFFEPMKQPEAGKLAEMETKGQFDRHGVPAPKAYLYAIPKDKDAPFDIAKAKAGDITGYVGKVKGWTPEQLVKGAELLCARLAHRASGSMTGAPNTEEIGDAIRYAAKHEAPEQIKQALDVLIREESKKNPPTRMHLVLIPAAGVRLLCEMSNRDADNLAAWTGFCAERGITFRNTDTGETLVQGTADDIVGEPEAEEPEEAGEEAQAEVVNA